ncbi:MAG TPA: DcaP family trimeric outer membrane transporter [Bacteroidales bacterium]|nr:DcaP family trimeric outer membrane transporter [Bacteroidales bacterium]HNS46617.1 DcaP family trimeric outer membrane transporter [Bacteroidales bacterium]
MSNKLFCALFAILLPVVVPAQDFGIKFSGFVKNDIIYDSRQTVSLRQGHYLLYPDKELPDENGEDINAKSSFHFLSIQSRIKGDITAPEVLGAKPTGLIEAEFFGNIEQNINSFRLRHAYIMLSWPKTELMIGQYWHAMFITECFPNVVSFNTGAPFQPFARNPQIRLTQKIGSLSVIGTALSEIDFVTNGPDGGSSKYIRNAAFPELNLKLTYTWKNQTTGHEFFAGVGGDYKRIMPRLVTSANYKDREVVSGLAWMGFVKYKIPAVTFSFEYVYGENFHSLTMLGGYAVEEVTDMAKDFRTYTPIRTMSLWGEIQTNGKTWQAGLFGGYSRNAGSADNIDLIEQSGSANPKQTYYSRGSDIAYLYRIAPRLLFNSGRFRVAAEIEYTVAAYGQPDLRGQVQDAAEVGNFRFLLGTYLFF